MNLLLTASVRDADDFKKNGYDSVKHEFSEWCDSSACIFAKIDQYHVVELFFNVNPAKLREWLSRPSTKEMFASHEFEPTRYTFSPMEIG